MTRKKWRGFSSSQVIMIGFLIAILIGTFLLMLPFSTKDSGHASFADALFTATSAVCVTGLVVQDTATYWSTFGHLVIISLIQIGGMGFITFALAFSMISGRKIGLKQRNLMQDSISAHQLGGIVKLTGFILKMTAAIEFLGAALMFPRFLKEYGFFKGLGYSLFHSISAFCNAGFDLMGYKGKFSSLTSYEGDTLMNFALVLMIILGGLGFLTWNDIVTNKWHFRKYRMQSKVIIVTTSILFIVPAIIFYFFEFNNVGLNVHDRILGSIFMSVTARTAGFNTLDFGLMSEAGLALMIFLMLIGGAPGSTAGGMKVTTPAVMFSNMIAVFRKRSATSFFGRRIENDVVCNAATIVTMYVTLFVTGGCLISRIDGLPLGECLFETASAVATVGVTMGITPSLSLASRAIIVLLMYLGRVGGLTIVFATVAENSADKFSRLPQEKLTVG